jgi:hypothetical protein
MNKIIFIILSYLSFVCANASICDIFTTNGMSNQIQILLANETQESFRENSQYLNGGAIVFKLKNGQSIVLKHTDIGNETDAYLLSQFLDFKFVPYTELIFFNNRKYSAQLFYHSKKIKYVLNTATVEVGNIAQISENALPAKLVLFDALFGNFDRNVLGHNYFITNDPPPEIADGTYDFSQRGPYNIENPEFLAFDHSNVDIDYDLAEWINKYYYFENNGNSSDKQAFIQDLFRPDKKELILILNKITAESLAALNLKNPSRIDGIMMRAREILIMLKKL